MDWLCRTHGLPVAALPAARSDSVLVNIMDRPIARGAVDPKVVQFFQAYDVGAGECTLQGF